jgi:glyoxylase-like metal-dependent hydrolase (beta-lactamase superfamily II)
MPPLSVTRLESGDLVLQSALWATNSVIVFGEEGCLVCDPSIFPDEIAQIRERTRDSGSVHVLITHSDFDHVCGLPAFARDAVVVAGTSTAAAIADGTARRKLDESGVEWGTAWEGELRVDLVASAASGAPVRCGDLEVGVVDCRGHSDDGSAFVIAARRLLLAGDYLSAVCPPIVLGSFDAAVASIERLLRAIDEHRITAVVPGHGPVLDAAQAREIGREDIRYLRALQERAAAAVQAGLSPSAAFLSVRAVPQPRAARADCDAFDWLGANARRALAEAGAPLTTQPDRA